MIKIIKTDITLLLFVAAIILFPDLSAKNQQKKSVNKPIQSTTELLPLDTAVKVGKLSNGFSYYIRKNTEPKNRVTIYLANKVGSVLENDDQQGLAHFMEHMCFNGTKHFPKNELVSYLQKSGVRFGADLNAYTSFDETVYQLPLPTDNPELLRNGFQIMRDWAQDDLLDSVEINNERGVILEEKRLQKSAQQRLQNKYLPILLNQSRYSNRLPIGTEHILTTFSPVTLRSFYKDWYRPDLQALIVVGDIDVTETEKTIISMFSDLKIPVNPKLRTKYSIPLTDKNQFFTATDKELTSTSIQVYVKHPHVEMITTADYRQSMIRSLYNLMAAERFSELAKQANPPFISGGSSVGGLIANIDIISAKVVGKPGELEKGFKALWVEIERIKRFGFTQTELKRAKIALLQRLETIYKERDKTKSESYVKEYLNLFLKNDASPGIDYEYEFYKNNFDGITLNEINQLVKEYWVDTNRDILVLGSEKDVATLPSESTVNNWMIDIQQSNVSMYIDNVSEKPLLVQKPIAGKIISETKNEKLGLVELTLGNGVKVKLKSTNFKNDEILFKAFSPGGTSLYNDNEYESALHADNLIAYSGVSDFNAVQLQKFLTGKKAVVVPNISDRSEGIAGYGSPTDFETTLQLIYLYFTKPRKDAEVYKGALTQQKAELANRYDNPVNVFTDSVAAIIGNYNVRRTGPSIEKLEKVNIDRAFEIYNDRFADASDFTFVFVGNLDVDKIKPLLELYLGALPNKDRIENAHDLGIHIPTGKIEKKVFKGMEPKSTVRLIFSGDYQYSEDENSLLSVFSALLKIKLTERLREEEGGVYSIATQSVVNKYPHNRFASFVSYSCAPENVEKLISSTLDEIKKIKENGPTQVDVDKIIAESKRGMELQLKDNSYWLNYIVNQFENKNDIERLLSFDQNLKKITPEAIKDVAKKYITGDNYLRIVMYPENYNINTVK